MKTEHHEFKHVFLVLALLLAFCLTPRYAGAQETEVPKETAGQVDESGLTDAERVIRLQKIIEMDRQKLAADKKDLAEREAFFEEVAGQIEPAELELAEKKKQLDDMGGATASDEAAALAAEIQNIEQLLVAGKTQSDLTFQAVKALQGQIQALEQKIAGEERALQNLIGPSAAELDAEPAAPDAAPAPQQAAPTTPSPTQMLIPGAGTTPAAPTTPKATQPETAEQIEARREAEKLEEEALRAEKDIVSFVERKEALESQIDIEQKLLETAKQTRENVDTAMAAARAGARRLIAEDASPAEIQRAQETIDSIEKLQRENREEIDRRREYLDSLRERLETLHEEELAVTQQAEAKRLKAAAARKRVGWLESPLHPRNVSRWLTTRGPRMLLVVVVAWALLWLVRLSARWLARTVVGTGKETRARGAKRADTLALSFRSAVSLFIVVASVLLVFQEAGVDVKTVLGGAAILGVALAFGAQNLMRDYFTGFMILLEDQYELGDLITIGGITGTVEKVNMRTTMLRDIEGRVHFIPNGEIKSVTNRTYVWGRAVFEVPIGFKEDVDRVMEVILEVAKAFRDDPEVGDWVTDDPVMLGVDKFTDSGVIIKFMIQTQPDKIFATRRQLLRRIKKRFDKEGIEISVPYRALVQPPSGGPDQT